MHELSIQNVSIFRDRLALYFYAKYGYHSPPKILCFFPYLRKKLMQDIPSVPSATLSLMSQTHPSNFGFLNIDKMMVTCIYKKTLSRISNEDFHLYRL